MASSRSDAARGRSLAVCDKALQVWTIDKIQFLNQLLELVEKESKLILMLCSRIAPPRCKAG